MEWQRYFKQELNTPSRDHYYLAQIAAEVRRGNVKAPGEVTIEQFVLPFTTKKTVTEVVEKKDNAIARSKAAWLGITGRPAAKLPAKVKNG